MRADKIEVGKVYKMKWGWYRKPVRLFVAHTLPYVEFLVGRSPDKLSGVSRGPQEWFSLNVEQ